MPRQPFNVELVTSRDIHEVPPERGDAGVEWNSHPCSELSRTVDDTYIRQVDELVAH